MHLLRLTLLLSLLAVPFGVSAQVVDTTPPTAPGLPTSLVTITNANTITWEWTPATDPETAIQDYLVDVGTTISGSEVVQHIATDGHTRYIITGLVDTVTYYAQVRAVNGAGLVSPVASDTIGVVVDQIAPTFIGPISLITRGAQTATLRWETDEPTRALVRYWQAGASDRVTTALELYQHQASVTLNTLCAGTIYQAAVEVSDQAANQTVSHEITFETTNGEPCPRSQETATVVEPTANPSPPANEDSSLSLSLASPQSSALAERSPSVTPSQESPVVAGQRDDLWPGLAIAALLGIGLAYRAHRRRRPSKRYIDHSK